jgi:hypothetical protein
MFVAYLNESSQMNSYKNWILQHTKALNNAQIRRRNINTCFPCRFTACLLEELVSREVPCLALHIALPVVIDEV